MDMRFCASMNVLLRTGLVLSLVCTSLAADEKTGQQIFAEMCPKCHGKKTPDH